MTYILKIDDQEFRIDPSEIDQIDIIKKDITKYHIIDDGLSVEAYLVEEDHNDKTVAIKVNNNIYHFRIEDKMDQLIKAMGYADKKIQAFKELKAPMPGLILEIQVSEGQDIEEGDTLLILEAMKMENVIKAPGSGKVKRILLEKGAKVDKNEVIIEMA